MEKLCGLLERVGDLTGGNIVRPTDEDGNQYVIGSYRAASVLDVIQIGGTVLKKPMCEGVLAQQLVPGRQACLYVTRVGRKPVLVGVKYGAEKFMITKTYLRGSMLQMATIFAFMYGLGGVMAGGIVAGMILPGSWVPPFAMLCGAALGLMWWYRAYQFWQAYGEAKAD
jgi:hypothetical protein